MSCSGLADILIAEASDSEDQFTDAQSAPTSPGVSSPLPKTRVEKVDNEPSFGEVPGTEAYKKREQDAEPDEIAMIPKKTSTPHLLLLWNRSLFPSLLSRNPQAIILANTTHRSKRSTKQMPPPI